MADFQFHFVDQEGNTTLINDEVNVLLRDYVGFGLLDLEPTMQRLPNQDGVAPTTAEPWEPDRYMGITIGIKDINLPYWIWRDSQLQAVLVGHRYRYNPQNPRLGLLLIVYPDGQREREIACWLTGYGQDQADIEVPTYGTRKLVFWAPDPHYRDPIPVTVFFTAGAEMMPGFLSPVLFPRVGCGENWYIDALLLNAGTAPTWPVFTLYGPLAWPRLENIDSGEWAEVPLELATGDILMMTMETGESQITRADGTVETTNAMTPGSIRWRLVPRYGWVRISARLVGDITDVSNNNSVQFYKRFKGL